MKIILLFLVALFPFTILAQDQVKADFSTDVTIRYSYQYVLHKPAVSKQKKPLIIFLHGSGEKGTDIEKVKVHGPLKYLKTASLDAFILAPQCPETAYWESESLHQLIQKIIQENNIDTSKIYLTGLSMGAWGAWNLAIAHPETFAALVPIAGFVDRVPMIENCKLQHIPIKIYHGLMDDVVSVDYSVAIYKRLKQCNTNIELIIFDDANHDSWSRVYDDVQMYNWMFKQVKLP